MATTTNFGWTTPNDTDLVKNGAAAIRTLGSAIDTSFVDLKGGTTGQFLAKATNTDLDYTWTTPSAGGFTAIQSGSLSGTTTSLTSIPGTYRDLRLVLRNVYMTPSSTVYQFQFNSDTGNKYTYIWQNNTAATNVTDSATQFQTTTIFPTSSNNASTIMMNMYDYTSTTNHKLCDMATIGSGGDPGVFNTAFYESSSAITSIQIKGNGQTIAGTYVLYGVN